jgi:hypothetical protein
MAHLSADVVTIFFIILMISYIYNNNNNNNNIKKKNLVWLPPPFWPKGWLNHPQGTISDTYSNHRGHIMKFIKPQGYIWEKKLCLSNKHLFIFWVISIGHAYNFVFLIVTHD